MRYDYLENIKEDILEYIKENKEYLKDEEQFNFDGLCDELFIEDSITGNASGSYTFNSYTAKEYVEDNIDLLQGALLEFGEDNLTAVELIDKGWEWCDVTIRCSLLYQAIDELKDEILEILEEEEE